MLVARFLNRTGAKPLNVSFRGFRNVSLRSSSICNNVRCYASPTGSKKTREEAPGFKKIFLVAVVGTLVFVQAANSLEKNKPKTSYSEEEFENVMNGLKRRVAMFPAGTFEVKFVPFASESNLNSLQAGSSAVVDPEKVVEHYRGQKDGTYEALLNELRSKHKSKYIDKLPNGMLAMLIGKYMKENCSPNDKVVIINFPRTIKDAIKFENEVCTVSRVIIPKSEAGSDISHYYETVNKVEQV